MIFVFVKKIKVMKKILILIFISLNELISQQVYWLEGNICPLVEPKLVINEEFDGSEINLNLWKTWFPYSSDGSDSEEACRVHGGTSELQVYRNENVALANGKLKLTAQKIDNVWFNKTYNYTSGMIQSNAEFHYGKFEVNCKLPKGVGFWPAFWLFGHGDELDIFENGGDDTNEIKVGTRQWNGSVSEGGAGPYYSGDEDLSLDFHTYTAIWNPDHSLSFYLDGSLLWKVFKYLDPMNENSIVSCTPPSGFYKLNPLYPVDKMNIICNLAVSNGPFTYPPNPSTTFPSSLEVEYIRVWQYEIPEGFTDMCNTTISGVDRLCDFQEYEFIINGFNNSNAEIITSSNIELISRNGNNVRIKALNLNSETAFIKVRLNSACSNEFYTKNITLGIGEILGIDKQSRPGCCYDLTASTKPSNEVGKFQAQILNNVYTYNKKKITVCNPSQPNNVICNYKFTINNSCGMDELIGSVILVRCGSIRIWRMSPNPGNDYTFISAYDDNDNMIDISSLINKIEFVNSQNLNIYTPNLDNNQLILSQIPIGLYTILVYPNDSDIPESFQYEILR